ncbi:hypothetical protein [Streptomyces sp. NPDC054783]
MSFHKLVPVKKHCKPAPERKRPAPKRAVHTPKRRPVGDKG